jgi:hypothetical protein
MSDKPPNLTGIWRGYLSGSNRGRIAVRLRQKGSHLESRAVFLGHQFGPLLVLLRGSLEGRQAKFRPLEFSGFAPVLPLDGEFSITFDENFKAAEGTWSTDIGTSGVCKLERSNESWLKWYSRSISIKLGWFVQRWRGKIYALILVIVTAAAMTQRVKLSVMSLVLLLLPAPFLFSHHLARLAGIFQGVHIKKIGPIEFDQNPPTAEIVAIATQHAHENVAFAQLNQFFVLRTKILLAILVHGNGMSLAEFGQLAGSFGVPPENVETTLLAIRQMGCAQVVDGRVIPLEWGRRYVQGGLRLA